MIQENFDAAKDALKFCRQVEAFIRAGNNIEMPYYYPRSGLLFEILEVDTELQRTLECIEEELPHPEDYEDWGRDARDKKDIPKLKTRAEKIFRDYIAGLAISQCATDEVIAALKEQKEIDEAVAASDDALRYNPPAAPQDAASTSVQEA